MTQFCPNQRLKVGNKPQTHYSMPTVQTNIVFTMHYKREIQSDPFKKCGYHGNYEHATSLIWVRGVPKEYLGKVRKFVRERSKCFADIINNNIIAGTHCAPPPPLLPRLDMVKWILIGENMSTLRITSDAHVFEKNNENM